MAIQFEFYKSPIQKEGETVNYHPRLVNFQHVSTQKLAAEIHSATTFTTAEVEAMLMELSRCLGNHLQEGHRVHLDGVGYFQITLKATEPIYSINEHADKVQLKTINFLADKDLKSSLAGIHIQRSKYKPHSATLTEEEIDKILTAHFATNTVLTRRNMQSLCHFTRSMAIRHITRLKEKGCLQNIGTTFQPIYVPGTGWYGK